MYYTFHRTQVCHLRMLKLCKLNHLLFDLTRKTSEKYLRYMQNRPKENIYGMDKIMTVTQS